MSFIKLTVLCFFCHLFIQLGVNAQNPSGSASSTSLTTVKPTRAAGYMGVANLGNEFIAVGTSGRIDRISASGKILKSEQISGEDFNCVLTDKTKMVVAGERGSIYISQDKGAFRKINSGYDKNINALALFRGIVLAAADEGVILLADDKGSFQKIYLPVNGNIVSLSAREADCFGVTDAGEIIRTTDGKSWDVFDFNQVYASFYKPTSFTAVLATERQIAVAGVANDGSPVLMFSNQGNVWSDRSLNYNGDQGVGYPEDTPNGLAYDATNDLFFMAFTNGKLMKIPSCSHCNRLIHLPAGHLTAISGNDTVLMVVGADYFVQIFEPNWE
jgi:hypothetical protein